MLETCSSCWQMVDPKRHDIVECAKGQAVGGDTEEKQDRPAARVPGATFATVQVTDERALIALMAASIYATYKLHNRRPDYGERDEYGAVLEARKLLEEVDRQLAPEVDPSVQTR